MSNQLNYYSFTINKPNNEKINITYTTRSLTQAKLKAGLYAKEIGGELNPKYIKSPTPIKPSDPELKKMIQTAYFK